MAVHEAPFPQLLEVYPNPATDILCLKGLPDEAVDYAIFNMMGQKVKAVTTHGTLPVAELGKGVYLLQIDSNKCSSTAKFVVK